MAQAELGRDLARRDREQVFDDVGWRHCAKVGLQGLPLPERYGGGGADAISTAAAYEGLGQGCADNGLNFSLGAQLWGCAMPIAAFGSEPQKSRFLPRLASGECVGALAMTETESGSDAYSLQARAERRGDRYVLQGRKLYVTNAPIADLIVVLASVAPERKAHGVTGFLVEKGTAGLVAGPLVEKMGLRTVPMGEVRLEKCEIPAENRLGPEGGGLALFNHAMEWERGLILAPALGAMQRVFDSCRKRARTRRQFGRPIGSFQQIATKIVDMQLRLECARLLLYKAAWLKHLGKGSLVESAMAKLHVSEAWVRACEDAIQIHGAEGYATAAGIERELRDALASRIYSGTSEIQREVIAHWMGLR
jgi:alkylation response protein AidB-like acyl-CoA dehydrogenase